jgi:hypothetical protein
MALHTVIDREPPKTTKQFAITPESPTATGCLEVLACGAHPRIADTAGPHASRKTARSIDERSGMPTMKRDLERETIHNQRSTSGEHEIAAAVE